MNSAAPAKSSHQQNDRNRVAVCFAGTDLSFAILASIWDRTSGARNSSKPPRMSTAAPDARPETKSGTRGCRFGLRQMDGVQSVLSQILSTGATDE